MSLDHLRLSHPARPSGNPSGRLKIPEDVKELARGLTKEAIATLADVMRDIAAPHSARLRAAYPNVTNA